MYCTHCGHENPEGANFCANCGRPLAAAAGEGTTGALHLDDLAEAAATTAGMDVESIVADLDPGTALLVSARGPNAGARFLLDRDVVTVGRHPDSDIFLDDITVSRRHAEFRREGPGYWLHDVGSLNGTYVNSERVDDRVLATGDEVQVGKFKLVVFLSDSP